jgi:alpha-glucosidase
MLLLLALRGTPTIYYGEEIGMVDVPVATEDARDPLERREPGRGRDPERSPMQWDASQNAGFTSPEATPWLPIARDASVVNVAGQAEDRDSILTLTRDLIRLRKEHPVLRIGDFAPFGPAPDGVLAFRRIGPSGQLNVLLNLTAEDRAVADAGPGQVLIGTLRDRDGAGVDRAVKLRPNEAIVIESTD